MFEIMKKYDGVMVGLIFEWKFLIWFELIIKCSFILEVVIKGDYYW